jgi:hypothetical protein
MIVMMLATIMLELNAIMDSHRVPQDWALNGVGPNVVVWQLQELLVGIIGNLLDTIVLTLWRRGR